MSCHIKKLLIPETIPVYQSRVRYELGTKKYVTHPHVRSTLGNQILFEDSALVGLTAELVVIYEHNPRNV